MDASAHYPRQSYTMVGWCIKGFAISSISLIIPCGAHQMILSSGFAETHTKWCINAHAKAKTCKHNHYIYDYYLVFT